MYGCGQGRSVGIATGYGLDGPGIELLWRERFSVPVQSSPEAHPASYKMDTWSLPGVKRPERGVYQQHPFGAEVKEAISLLSYGSSWPLLG